MHRMKKPKDDIIPVRVPGPSVRGSPRTSQGNCPLRHIARIASMSPGRRIRSKKGWHGSAQKPVPKTP
jgi:hypothetical protein